MNEWISVNERLPEVIDQYLVIGPHGIQIATYNSVDLCWDDADGDDYWKDLTGWFTHWMPLPSSPKETPCT